MTDRERFIACLTGQPVDRPPYWIFWGPWATTWQRWRGEGMPESIGDYFDLHRHFGSDQRPLPLPVNFGPCPKFERKVLREDDQFVTFVDSWGIVRRDFKDHTSMADFVAFPVKDGKDWQRYKQERLDPQDPRRLEGNWREVAADYAARDIPIQVGAHPDLTVFGAVRWLLGDEDGLASFYTAPDLVHDIMERMTDIFITVLSKVAAEVRIDMIHIWEDMCGRQGPLISPRHFEEFMSPCYRRIRRLADEHGIPLVSVDTDGWPDLIVPPMMRAGVNFLFPWEVQAGCDVNAVRRKFPDLGIMGGIDKRALAVGPEAIDRELERVRPAVESGRYIPELDHLVPDNVPWENYSHYARRLKELVGKAE